jgi:hypothetical protein
MSRKLIKTLSVGFFGSILAASIVGEAYANPSCPKICLWNERKEDCKINQSGNGAGGVEGGYWVVIHWSNGRITRIKDFSKSPEDWKFDQHYPIYVKGWENKYRGWDVLINGKNRGKNISNCEDSGVSGFTVRLDNGNTFYYYIEF